MGYINLDRLFHFHFVESLKFEKGFFLSGKENMARPIKHSKIEQMRSQEEIIQRKKMEILEKQRKQEMAKQLAAAAVGSGGTSTSTTPASAK